MSLAPNFPKTAQMSLDGIKINPSDISLFDDLKELGDDLNDLNVEMDLSPETEEEEHWLTDGATLEGEIILQVGDDNKLEQAFSFDLPKIPGAEDQSDLEMPEEEVQEAQDQIHIEQDPWKWTLQTAMQWLQERLKSVPRHSGKDVSGVSRAIGYLNRVLGEISKMVKVDYDNMLDINAVEDSRNSILEGLERLEERLSVLESFRPKKKKRASLDEDGFIKEAGTPAYQVQVPYLISSLCRVIINGSISAGHHPEVMFEKLSKKFDLTKREQWELVNLLADSGYPVRRDRGYLLDEEIDTTSSNNFDWTANFSA